MRIITGSGDRVSSYAAAVVVDGFDATCPWDISFYQGIQSTSLADIPIAFCSIAIVVVVWPDVGLCFQANILFFV